MNALDTYLDEVRVGLLERFEDENHVFTFDEQWLADPDRPVLGQLFEDRRPAPIRTSGLPCWFAHLLPQRGPLRRLLARAADADADDDIALLSIAGEDLPGAIRLVPAERTPGAAASTASDAEDAGGASAYRPRFSLAGAQWKLSVRHGERGLTLSVMDGPGTWIAKFHDPEHPRLPLVEQATTSWAGASGIDVPETRLARIDEFDGLPDGIPTGDGTVFLSRRFDRRQDARVHMEDFGQILDRPPGEPQYRASYEEVARVLRELTPSDVRPFVDQLVFCILSGNGDAHLKNWSVLYADRRTARLSPGYDLVSTILYLDDEDLALSLGDERRFESVTRSSFRGIAAAIDHEFDEVAKWVDETSSRVRDRWTESRSEFGFLAGQVKRIDEHLAAVTL